MFKKIEGHSELKKSSQSGAVVSTNMREFQEHVKRKKREQEKDLKISDLENRLSRMEALLEKLTDAANAKV